MTGHVLQPRSPQRYKVFQPGEMTVGGVAHRIHFLDISEVGARVHSAEVSPQVDDEVVIHCVFALGRARVTWVKNAYFGVQFATPVLSSTIQGIVEAERVAASK